MEQEILQQVQPVLLEIAREIKRVCEENNIRYFMYRGTFLGAVRHQGFIPWDDDMDFAMLREDYEKFRKIAPEKMNPQYCFQDWHTDPGYAHPFGKVRKRGTRYVEAKCRPLAENGFYVDIYPLDFAPEDPAQRAKLARQQLHLYRVKLMKSKYTPWKEGDRVILKKRIGYLLYQTIALFVSQKTLIRTYERISQVPAGDTLYEQSALPRAYYFEKGWCETLSQYPFDGETFPGPADYDSFLGSLYGNYMELPPEGQRENRHQIMELDFGQTTVV